jgi:putative peptidoglycan lipid II flippase
MKFLNTQTKSVSFASLILAGSYVVSALLGLFRDHLLAGRLGAGNELDAYYSAFTIPDFIALILIFGAISAAIIPIFSSYLVKSKEEAWYYVSNLLNIFLTFLILVSVVLIIFAPFVVSLIAPGFSTEKKEMTVTLMRIMFLSPIILGTSTVMSGILQVFHRFLVTALTPIMYNAGIIIGIVFFVPVFGLKGLAFGVVLGGLLHLAIQVPAFLHSGFAYRPVFDLTHTGVKKTLKLMVPRSLGLGAGQFNTIVITAIASTLAVGSIALFNLTNTLSAILVNAVAVSLSTAIFPTMSLAHSNDDKRDFQRKFSGAFLQILFLSIPISIGMFFLRAQIARIVWGSGKFTWTDTRLAAACLGIFSLGLLFQGLIFLFSKTFYAVHNTKIPAWISAGTVAFNIAMSFVFLWLLSFANPFSYFLHAILKLQTIQNISVTGLALAFTITAICESSLLLFFVHKKLHIFNLRDTLTSLYKILAAGVAMAVVLLVVRDGLVRLNIINLQKALGVFFQLAIAGFLGAVAYVAVSFWLKSQELKKIKSLFL